MKTLIQLCVAGMLVGSVLAGDAPRGFMELDELPEAQEKAGKSDKLVALVVKGSDDACPRCAATLENGTKAIKSDCVLVFMRAKQAHSGEGLPESAKAAVKGSPDGAWVCFYVFDADLNKLIAKADRKGLESDEKATKAFKKEVKDARKEAKGK